MTVWRWLAAGMAAYGYSRQFGPSSSALALPLIADKSTTRFRGPSLFREHVLQPELHMARREGPWHGKRVPHQGFIFITANALTYACGGGQSASALPHGLAGGDFVGQGLDNGPVPPPGSRPDTEPC